MFCVENRHARHRSGAHADMFVLKCSGSNLSIHTYSEKWLDAWRDRLVALVPREDWSFLFIFFFTSHIPALQECDRHKGEWLCTDKPSSDAQTKQRAAATWVTFPRPRWPIIRSHPVWKKLSIYNSSPSDRGRPVRVGGGGSLPESSALWHNWG